MTVSSVNNSVNFKGQFVINNTNGSQLPSFCPHSKIARKLCNDVFIKISQEKQAEAVKELERLFPNNELNQIYNKIVKDYGIENPPQFVINPHDTRVGAAYHNKTNSIILNPAMISDSKNCMKIKFEFESNGKTITGYYPALDKPGEIKYVNSEKSYLPIKTHLEKKGIKSSIEPLTDNDIRKTVILTLAHELRHAYQAQLINQCEGLGMYKLLKEQALEGRKNLIDRKITELNFDNQYKTYNWSKYPTNIKYKKGTDEWNHINKIYDATLHYTPVTVDYKKYITNPIEIDADSVSAQYLENNYPELCNSPSKDIIENLRAKLN